MKRVLAFVAALFLATPAQAWWDFGHRTVAAIAWGQVTPGTRTAIRRLLTHERALATPACPLRSLEDASVWADCIKPLSPRWSYAFSWHYQNVDVCKPFDLAAACKDGNCVSAQIDRQVKLLADGTIPARERLEALAFLTHFVGDLHMPLHGGDRDDRGGNDLKASYGIYAGSRLNIHGIWDGYLAERAITTPEAGPAGLLAEFPAAERAAVAAGTTAQWSEESWAIARDAVYASALGGDPCGPPPARARIDDARIEAAIPVLRRQIARGGLRLARLLDEALTAPSR